MRNYAQFIFYIYAAILWGMTLLDINSAIKFFYLMLVLSNFYLSYAPYYRYRKCFAEVLYRSIKAKRNLFPKAYYKGGLLLAYSAIAMNAILLLGGLAILTIDLSIHLP